MSDVPIPEKYRQTTYQLTNRTVSPTRVVARDADGIDVEETITAYPWTEMFVDRAGNLVEVVMCNSRTTARNNEAQAYAMMTRADQITAGALPLAECPHAVNTEYRRLIGVSYLVAVPADYEPCEGAPTGCKHLRAIRANRLKAQAERTARNESQQARMTSAQSQQIENVFGRQVAPIGNRSALLNNRGEED